MRITESQLRRIVRQEVLREAGLPALPNKMTPEEAAKALVARLGRRGAEELVDTMYLATGSDARAAERRFTAELQAVGAGPLALDNDWASETYSALTDITNPWDARK